MENKKKLAAIDITLVAMMIAIIEVSKIVLMGIPNVETVSFWIIMFTVYYKRKMFFVLPAFILIEGIIFGFGIWWIMYIYSWPLLSFIAWIFRKNKSAVMWAVISGIFGLLYGLLCSIPYFFIGLADGGIAGGISSSITWWIAGIPYDLIHGVANFAIMIIFYHPIIKVMNSVDKWIR